MSKLLGYIGLVDNEITDFNDYVKIGEFKSRYGGSIQLDNSLSESKKRVSRALEDIKGKTKKVYKLVFIEVKS